LKFESFAQKNLVHKGVNFEAKNTLKLTYEHLYFPKNFRGLYPRTPSKRGRGGEEREEATEERPPIYIPGYATVRRRQPQFSSPLPPAAFHQQILPIARLVLL